MFCALPRKKREQKPTAKYVVGFHNHSPLLTMASLKVYLSVAKITLNTITGLFLKTLFVSDKKNFLNVIMIMIMFYSAYTDIVNVKFLLRFQ